MGIELNKQQLEATKRGIEWWNTQNNQTFEVSGPAGSGKTTIVKYIIQELGLNPHEVLFMAYVGKAAMALARSGNNAKTIHSSIYNLVEVPKINEDGEVIKKNGRIVMTTAFEKKPTLHPDIKALVIDEGSMVNKKIAEDILSFGLPVLILGDLNQLPPVFGDPYFLIKPDVILTQIMRQKENDPIIHLSQRAIRGEKFEIGKYGPMCFVIDKEFLTDNLLTKSDIVICGKNKTRESINNYVRKQVHKIDSSIPQVGEKIICRQNNWKISIADNINLINGMIGYVENIYLDTYNKRSLCIDFRPEFLTDDYFEKIAIDYDFLFQPLENKTNKRSFYNKFEFAYAISCHLSQGSQYNKVLVYDEKIGDREYYNKWRYTAVTRAIEGLVVAI